MKKASASKTEKSRGDPQAFFERWRTWQFSDHFPLWVRLEIDDSAKYLEGLR